MDPQKKNSKPKKKTPLPPQKKIQTILLPRDTVFLQNTLPPQPPSLPILFSSPAPVPAPAPILFLQTQQLQSKQKNPFPHHPSPPHPSSLSPLP